MEHQTQQNMETHTINFVELTTERFNGLSGDTATLYDVANFIKDLHAEWTKDHEKELKDFIIENSRLREERKEQTDKYNDLRNLIQRFHQTLIARNYNNVGVWHNERQQYNYELIQEIETILTSKQ